MEGSYSFAVARAWAAASFPPAMSTLPSGSSVAVWPARLVQIGRGGPGSGLLSPEGRRYQEEGRQEQPYLPPGTGPLREPNALAPVRRHCMSPWLLASPPTCARPVRGAIRLPRKILMTLPRSGEHTEHANAAPRMAPHTRSRRSTRPPQARSSTSCEGRTGTRRPAKLFRGDVQGESQERIGRP